MTVPWLSDVEFEQTELEVAEHPPSALTDAFVLLVPLNHVAPPGEAAPEMPI
jgi:hypothetical protein